MKERDKELLGEALDAAFRGDEELATGFAKTFNQEHQPEEGCFGLRLGDGNVRSTPPGSAFCKYCKKTVHWGAGISFTNEDDLLGHGMPIQMTAHLTLKCTALRFRWYRWRYDHGGRTFERWRSNWQCEYPRWKVLLGATLFHIWFDPKARSTLKKQHKAVEKQLGKPS